MNLFFQWVFMLLLGTAGLGLSSTGSAANAKRNIILIAGIASHGRGEHEFNAGVQLLHQCLQNNPSVTSTFYVNGWPKDDHALDRADAIMLFMDGGSGHPILQDDHLRIFGDLMKRGVGLACIHYAVEVPKEKGGKEFLDWLGGYFEMFWSVNPHWEADFKELPNHPITRGVKPFKINDEWYYHMRFRENRQATTPILSAIPPDRTRGKPGASSSHGGNPHVQARTGKPEDVAWAYERPDGGRGFGLTGAHFHRNWGNENFRKVVLNALIWVAKAEVPSNGVECAITPEDLTKNLDPKEK
jgi:hypothetical protein